MAGTRRSATAVPTPGPWLVRGAAALGATPTEIMLGVAPAAAGQPGGFPYLIRQAREPEAGGNCLPLATGIQRLADARLMAAAPELAAILLLLLTTPALMAHALDSRSRASVDEGWDLLVRAAPHLEIGP